MIEFEKLLSALGSSGANFIIIGGVAATLHGSSRLTSDLDILYDRSWENLERLVKALSPLDPYLRGAPPGLPFRFDADTLGRGLNFTLTTTAGPVDLLGEIPGIGNYSMAQTKSMEVTLFGSRYRCLTLEDLITAKRAAGRPKDLDVLAELETILEERERENR
jgi:predicted nucleotidyltransferase